jgi:two-component system sensor histidine kinase QseC
MVKNYSLRARLLLWVVGSNILIWTLAGSLVWYDAAHDISELLAKIIDNTYTHDYLLHEREELLDDLIWSLVWPMIIGLPVLALIVTLIVYLTNRNLSRLGDTLANRKPLTFIPVESDDLPSELLPVVEELNHLFARMQRSVEKEQRFTADAAHELRTPMAAMRAQAQVASMSIDEIDRQHALSELMVSCDRGSHLVDQLLALARLENAMPSSPTGTFFDLMKLLRELMAGMMTESQKKYQIFGLGSTADMPLLMVTADEVLMRTLFRNLIDNAIRYSPAGSEIAVSAQIRGGKVCVLIEDSGSGMSDIDIDRLGERFFRSQNNDSTGSGLGWSIVRQIATAQNLQINVGRSERLGGLGVWVYISQ